MGGRSSAWGGAHACATSNNFFLYVFQAPRPLGVGERPAGAPIVEAVPLIVGFDDAEDR